MKKIALIPIDNRPVCYTLPGDIAKIDNELKLLLPPREFLGGLYSTANINGILNWLENIEEVDAIVISFDTVAYGGLVSSRRCEDSLEEIKVKLENFKTILKYKKAKIYAFSSIMRISNNNVNEEEKEYWDKYGKKIFEYSYNFHKSSAENKDVPSEILEDYMKTRKRNFEINKLYINWLEEGLLDTLVFSKDDCAEFGLNVIEAQDLEKNLKEKKLNGLVKTGADEIPLTLFARAVCNINKEHKRAPKISAKFLAPQHKNLISNYEDISIEKSVMAQLELANIGIADEKSADVILLINNFENHQGEIVMGVDTKSFSGDLNLPQKPYIIADVRFANGADNQFVEKLLKKIDLNNFWGYSAWNTSANTLGSLICAAVVRFFARNYNEEAFKKLQITRFLDDWGYQANVRQILKLPPPPHFVDPLPNVERGEECTTQKSIKYYPSPQWGEGGGTPDEGAIDALKSLMRPSEDKLFKIFEVKPEINYSFPWNRFFEIEVEVK